MLSIVIILLKSMKNYSSLSIFENIWAKLRNRLEAEIGRKLVKIQCFLEKNVEKGSK